MDRLSRSIIPRVRQDTQTMKDIIKDSCPSFSILKENPSFEELVKIGDSFLQLQNQSELKPNPKLNNFSRRRSCNPKRRHKRKELRNKSSYHPKKGVSLFRKIK